MHKNIQGYSKHFGVDKICAVLELRMLGYTISEDYLKQLKAHALAKQKTSELRKRELDDELNIVVTQCDCPYDMGEYCKHQVAVFLTLNENINCIPCSYNICVIVDLLACMAYAIHEKCERSQQQ